MLTLVGIFFFFLELCDSHFKRLVEVPTFYHLSRTNKRLLFYFYKIFFLKATKTTLILPKHLNSYFL